MYLHACSQLFFIKNQEFRESRAIEMIFSEKVLLSVFVSTSHSNFVVFISRRPPSAVWQTPQCPWTSSPSLSTWVCKVLVYSCLWTSVFCGSAMESVRSFKTILISQQNREVQFLGDQHCGPEQRKRGWRHLHWLHHEGRSCGCRRTHRTWRHAAAGGEE